MKQPRSEDKAKDTLTPDEVSALLATCDRKTATGARDFAIMLLLYSTGLRASELLALTEDDVAADKGLIVVRKGKGGKFRVVPPGRPAEKALLRYLDHPRRQRFANASVVFLTDEGEALGLNALQLALQRLGRAAGLHANPHKFRHSAAIQYLRAGVRLEFSRPGKPTDNAFIEAFNRRFRDECLNLHWFDSLEEAQATIEAWRVDYNTERPHGALGQRTPAEFSQAWTAPETWSSP